MIQGPQGTLDQENGQADAKPAISRPDGRNEIGRDSGSLIINADDWGRDCITTDRILDCALGMVVSSVSAMVFMEDSHRAALLAQQHDVDKGLHLNFTTPFSTPQCPSRLVGHLQQCARFLGSHRFAPAIYHPGLTSSFRYVIESQVEEFERLYGHSPNRVDGHHHMHLCANVLLGKLLPAGIVARRNFSFKAGEKGPINRAYRRWQDGALMRRHRTSDLFFSLLPLDPRSRLEGIFALAGRYNVEVETHPANAEEYRFLMGGELMRSTGEVKVARGYLLRSGAKVCDVEGYS